MNNLNILSNERSNPRQSPNLLYVKPSTNYELLNDIMNKNTNKRLNNKLVNFSGMNKGNNLQNNRYSQFTKQSENSSDNSLESYLSNLKSEAKPIFNSSASPNKLNYESKYVEGNLNSKNNLNLSNDKNYHFSKPIAPLLGINNLSYNALKNIASNNILKTKNLHNLDQINSVKKSIIAKINRNNSSNISRVLSPNNNSDIDLYNDQINQIQNRQMISLYKEKDLINSNSNLNTLENGIVNNLKLNKNYQISSEEYNRLNKDSNENNSFDNQSKGKFD
jgi:hypothetical protein